MSWQKACLALLMCAPLLSSAAACEMSTDHWRESFFAMRRLVGNGDYSSAIRQIEVLLVSYPEQIPLYESLAEICLYSGSFREGERILRDRFDYGGHIGCVYFGMGVLDLTKGKYAEAVDHCLDAMGEGLDVPQLYSILAECYCKTVGIEESIRYFTVLCHRNPLNPNVWYGLSLVYWEARRYSNIEIYLEKALQLSPNCMNYQQAKLSTLVLLGRFREAIELSNATLHQSDELGIPAAAVQICHGLAYSQIQLREFEQADVVLMESIATAKRFGYLSVLGWLSVLRSNLCYLTGRYDESLIFAKNARLQAEIVGDTALSIESCIWEHQSSTDLGRNDDGIISASKAGLASAARSDGLQTMLALVALSVSTQELGMDSLSFELAIESMSRMEQYAPDPYTRLLVAVRLSEAYMGVGNSQTGLELLQGIERNIPHRIRESVVATVAHGVKGNGYLKIGDFNRAKREFRIQLRQARAQRFRREECSAIAGLANVMLGIGHLRTARQLFYRCLTYPEARAPVPLRIRVLSGIAESFLRSGDRDSSVIWIRTAIKEWWNILPRVDFEYRTNGLWLGFRHLVRRYVWLLTEMNRIEEAFFVSQWLAYGPIHEEARSWGALLLGKEKGVPIGKGLESVAQLTTMHFDEIERNASRRGWTRSPADLKSLFAVLIREAETRKRLCGMLGRSLDTLYSNYSRQFYEQRGSPSLYTESDALVQYVVGERTSDVFVVHKSHIGHVRIGFGEGIIGPMLAKVTRGQAGGRDIDYALNRYSMDFNMDESRRLAEMIIAPWIPLVEAATNVVFVLDGCLQSFPFEVFVMSGGKGKGRGDNTSQGFLVESFAIRYAPSGIGECGVRDSRTVNDLRVVVVAGSGTRLSTGEWGIGDPAYGELGKGATISFATPGFAREADDVINLLDSPTRVLAGREATAHNIEMSLRGVDILHIAAHSWFDGPGGLRSTALLSSLRGHDEGVLYAHNVLSMSVDARLVFLSGCNTAGVLGRGDLGLGFCGAFRANGVAATVGSLWPVDDEATSLLVREFYAGISDGNSVAASLQKAKVAMICSGIADPYFWGGFVLIGEDVKWGRLKESTSPQWQMAPREVRMWSVRFGCFILGLSLLAAVFVGGIRFRDNMVRGKSGRE
jgi:CHAT domain-containing protein/tetratricopeptide (TPR) repeat protein